MAALTNVNITIKFRDGTKESICHSAVSQTDVISYSNLLKSLSIVQEQCNQLLTKTVEEEKHKLVNLNSSNDRLKQHKASGEDDEDEHDDDDDDNEVVDKEPPEKKQKTLSS
ncbi:hypothetical protein PoB_001217300 [Plakobranchus ocellatus]|uniref:EKC/KEOPS complex subunit GON7 n=1 Tax=Plakobranchus ocellatus TaxID=259542 RepID=A0AAV3YSZ0_9GAST|nr:hypothetical protein PoB_001217300 [Plakobranchus ocellatus]